VCEDRRLKRDGGGEKTGTTPSERDRTRLDLRGDRVAKTKSINGGIPGGGV